MPRKKPTARLDLIGNLELSPENAVGTYIESKQNSTLLHKPPEHDSAGNSFELLAIRNEREYLDTLKLQSEMIDNAKRQRIINLNRIDDIYKIENDLRERFISVNNFIQECESKRRFAKKKVINEQQFQEHIKKEMERYRDDIKELTEFRDVLKNVVKEFEPYEKIIQEVVDKNDILTSVKDCMDRCDGLMLAQEEILEMEKEKIRCIESMRCEMVKATNDAALTVLGLNNELAELERSYNNARSETFRWEKIMANAKDCISENELTRTRLLDSVQQIYRLLCKRRGIPYDINRDQIEEQFDFIKDEVEILQNIVKICKKEQK